MNINVTELVVSNLLGLFIGLATSFFSWWVLFHAIVPKVAFSQAISKIPKKSGKGSSYRIKFSNRGRRAVIGVEVYARVTFAWDETRNRTGLNIPLSSDAGVKYELPRLAPGNNRILSLWINKVSTFSTNERYPGDFRDKARDGELTLEDVLSQGKSATLQVFVSGYDEFSGARKIFLSPLYQLEDVKAGRFKGLRVSTAQTEAAESAEVPPPTESSSDGT